MNRTLWIVQGVLALIFLLAGGSKLVSSSGTLAAQFSLPTSFLRIIGVAEILGALGLVLPGLLQVRTGLTPLAATGLVALMIGAVATTLASNAIVPALLPLILGLLAMFVAHARWKMTPLPESSHRSPPRLTG